MSNSIFILSFSFMCIFSAFKTTNMISKLILESEKRRDASFTGNGYTALSIIYAVFSISSFFAPTIVYKLNSKRGLLFGGFFYVFHVGGFIYPKTWFLYMTSACIGFGASVLWASHATFITAISNKGNISRNSAIFWAFNEGSLFLGSCFLFWNFHGIKEIDPDQRIFLFTGLLFVGSMGLLGLSLLNEPKTLDNAPAPKTLFMNKKLLLLSLCSVYTGLEVSFYSGVFGSAIAFTNAFGTKGKSLVGIIGIFIGCGEIIGGLLNGIIGKRISHIGKSTILLVSGIVHSISYILIFVNLPNNASFGPTDDVSLLNSPNAFLLTIAAFLIGFGDACLQTQLIATMSTLFENNPASAFSIFKFVQSMTSATVFYLSSSLGMNLHISILLIANFFSCLSFSFVDKMT